MEYKKIHDDIIIRGKNRSWTRKNAPCYVEKHHIIPRSLDGSNSKDNIVFLTAKEHYIIHLLLTKIYDGVARDKMIRAFCRMCKGNSPIKRIVTPRSYQILREEYSKAVSRQVSGKNHPMYGKTHSSETKEKMRMLRLERIKNGTDEGNRKPHSEETKKKQSLIKLGKKHSDEHKRKIGLSITGRVLSETTRKKISEKRKLYWQRKKSIQSSCDI